MITTKVVLQYANVLMKKSIISFMSYTLKKCYLQIILISWNYMYDFSNKSK